LKPDFGSKRDFDFKPDFDFKRYFGFKRDLIRVIANLCHNSTANKILIKELEIMPNLLNCTKFDPENPFLREWAIFAIRNSCENFPENQKILAEMSAAQGFEDVDGLLEKLNLQLRINEENGRTFFTTKKT